MLVKWNALFIEERTELVAKALGKRVLIDIGGVTERNKKATADQIVSAPGLKDVVEESHISQQDAAVQSYKLEEKSGLGLRAAVAKTERAMALIVWLARAVKVERPLAPRLHLDCARFAGRDCA